MASGRLAAKIAKRSSPECGRARLFHPQFSRGWVLVTFVSLKAAARPGDLHHRAVIGEDAVAERYVRTGALEQGARDKDTKPEAAILALVLVAPASPRKIGLADPLQDIGGKARSVVGNLDLNGLVVPPGVDLDRGAREVHGILQNVADAVEDRGIAPGDRLLACRHRDAHLDRH